jgi:hypothetical protein
MGGVRVCLNDRVSRVIDRRLVSDLCRRAVTNCECKCSVSTRMWLSRPARRVGRAPGETVKLKLTVGGVCIIMVSDGGGRALVLLMIKASDG